MQADQATEPCPRCGRPGHPTGTNREGTTWSCEHCMLPFQVLADPDLLVEPQPERALPAAQRIGAKDAAELPANCDICGHAFLEGEVVVNPGLATPTGICPSHLGQDEVTRAVAERRTYFHRCSATRDYASLKELDTPFGERLGNPDRLEWLGTYTRNDYMVELWDTGDLDNRGWPLLAYRLCLLDRERAHKLSRAPVAMQDQMGHAYYTEMLTLPVWEIVFTGEDFSPGAADGDEELTLANLLGFLGTRPGDTDPDFFKHHTPRQLEFANEHGEELTMWSAELEGELD